MDFDLFGLENTTDGAGAALKAMNDAQRLVLQVSGYGYTLELNETNGHFTITQLSALTWTDTQHADANHAFTWAADGWDDEGTWDNGRSVTFVANGGADVTVTTSAAVTTNVLTTEGDNKVTFTGSAITVAGAQFGSDAQFSVDLMPSEEVRIKSGKTVTFAGGSLRMQAESSVFLEEGAKLTIVSNAGFYHESGDSRHVVDGEGGTVEVGAAVHYANLAFTDGVTLVLGSTAATVTDLQAAGTVQLSGADKALQNTNTIGVLDASQLTGTLTLVSGSTTITGTQDGTTTIGGGLTITTGTLTVENGDLEVMGVFNPNGGGSRLNVNNGALKLHKGLETSNWTPNIAVKAVEFLNDAESDRDYDGNLTAEKVVMNGAGSQSNQQC